MRRIMITDVTRMGRGNCCIAGICQDDNLLYRLCSPSYISQDVVRRAHLTVGCMYSGEFTRVVNAVSPHVEDCNYHLNTYNGRSEGRAFEYCLESSLATGIEEGLGVAQKGTPVDSFQSTGRSIVTISPTDACLWIDQPSVQGGNPALKMKVVSNNRVFNYIPVNDFRFYTNEGVIDMGKVEMVRVLLEKWRRGQLTMYVRCGLTRQYQGKYWLQVDGLHFFDNGRYQRFDEIASQATGVLTGSPAESTAGLETETVAA